MPERKQVDELVSSIQGIAEGSGVQIMGMATADASSYEETRYKKMLIGVDSSRSLSVFVNFLKLIEQSLRLYDVYEITAAASTTSVGSVNFSVKINAYYLK